MKFLICGLGSIGQRHLKNLRAVGENDIIAYRSSNKEVHLHFGDIDVPIFFNLAEAFKEKPDVVLVTNPTSLHIPIALEAAKKGCHLFIEKPISSNLSGIEDLKRVVKEKNLTVGVGCNMRFNPGLIRIKELLDKKYLGEVYFIKVSYSSYLPDWHPWDDFKKRYSARADLGGGIIFTIIHELDYPYWFFGEAQKVKCITNQKSFLGTDVDEVADILLGFKNGITGSIHLDYISKDKSRCCEITGERGKITWDYYKRELKFFSNSNNTIIDLVKDIDWQEDSDQMYIAELKDFIESVKNHKNPMTTLDDGEKVLKIALEAKKDGR